MADGLAQAFHLVVVGFGHGVDGQADLVAQRVERFLAVEEQFAPWLPRAAQGEAVGNAVEPRRELAVAPERRQFLVGTDKGILCDLFGVLGAVHDARHHAVDGVGIAVEEVGILLRVSGQDGLDAGGLSHRSVGLAGVRGRVDR